MTKPFSQLSAATVAQKREQRDAINDDLRAERKRLVKLGMIAGNIRADAQERSEYLNKRIRQAAGLEQ